MPDLSSLCAASPLRNVRMHERIDERAKSLYINTLPAPGLQGSAINLAIILSPTDRFPASLCARIRKTTNPGVLRYSTPLTLITVSLSAKTTTLVLSLDFIVTSGFLS